MADLTMLKGDRAVARGVLATQPDVVSAYPITPQTGIVESLSELDADGELDGEFLKVDSEFNAASSCLGASAAGARVFSATCSQGLKLMSEPLFTAAGMRLPLVLAVANRSLSAPISIWNDHTDAFAERDGGLIQFFAKDVQEAVDTVLMAYRVAEDPAVSLPALANLDGFILTHVKEPVAVPDEAAVADYLPRREPHATLDPSDPKTMGPVGRPEHWTETRYAVQEAMLRARDVIGEATAAFADQFGRAYGLDYGGLVETSGPPDADVALVGLGSVTGTIEHVIDEHPERVKLVRPRVIRPFPAEQLRDALAGVHAVGVLQKENSPGYQGSLAGELKAALYASDVQPVVRSYVLGLGGRDVPHDDVDAVIAETAAAAAEGPPDRFVAEERWPQVNEEMLPVEVTQG
jgi:pyruvate ferredoxin oxidoreductase alpha subunit